MSYFHLLSCDFVVGGPNLETGAGRMDHGEKYFNEKVMNKLTKITEGQGRNKK